MKVLLIQPPVRDFYFTAKRSIPYGLISIASELRRHGFDVNLIDALATGKSKVIPLPEEMSYLNDLYGKEDISPFALFHQYKYFGYSQEHLGNLIKKSNADVVGISSLFSAYSNEVFEIAALAKNKLPDGIVIVGGHHPTSMPKDSMSDPSVDYAIRGEGEVVLPELLHALQNGHPLKDIKGLVYRDSTGGIQINDIALMKNPDDYPRPATDLVNHKFYSRRDGASMVVTASRGCPMKCTYCCVASPMSTFRKRSTDSVFSEIEHSVNEHRVRFIDFEDENLTFDKKWFFSLMSRIKDSFSHLNLEFRAMNGLFPPTLNEEMISLMNDVGFRALNLSLCTTSGEQLKRFKRPDVRTSVEDAIKNAKKYGMNTVCYIIVGAPGQDASESVSDLLYLHRQDVVAGVSVFYPAPGSLEFERTQAKGLVPDQNSLLRSSVIPVSDTTSRNDSVTLLRLGRIMNFMKSVRDEGLHYTPKKIDESVIRKAGDKKMVGLHLLNAFLFDGRIRGVDTAGDIYVHKTSAHLTEKFLSGLGI